MSSLGINAEVDGPNNWMIEPSWVTMTKAERLLFTKGNGHVEWKSPPYAQENAMDRLVNVYDWLCLPLSKALNLLSNGWLDLSRFPCHQLNGSFNALSALRKAVHWESQGVFDENENDCGAHCIPCVPALEAGRSVEVDWSWEWSPQLLLNESVELF